MAATRNIGVTPAHVRFAFGYACMAAWAVALLLAPTFGDPATIRPAPLSMLPGLVPCLGSIFLYRKFPSLAGRTAFVTIAALLTAAGTLLCTYPDLASNGTCRIAGLALSGFFAIILLMAWFDAYARLSPRAVIVLAGCAISVASVICWVAFSLPAATAGILVSLLPMAAFIMLPAAPRARQANAANAADDAEGDCVGAGGGGRGAADAEDAMERGCTANGAGGDCADARGGAGPGSAVTEAVAKAARNPGLKAIMAAAVPLRTLVGLAITFFIVSSIGSLAPEFGLFSSVVNPASLLVPLGLTAFFVATALLARRSIDSSILYKILLSVFAAGVFLLAISAGISAPLVFYANITADVMMWTVLALWAKKTPVAPHLVFSVGWIAECVGNSLGQTVAPLFAGQIQVFFALAIMLIVAAIGFAFSEGHLMLDIDFEEADAPAGRNAGVLGGPSTLAANAVADGANGKPCEAGSRNDSRAPDGLSDAGGAADSPSGAGGSPAGSSPATPPSPIGVVGASAEAAGGVKAAAETTGAMRDLPADALGRFAATSPADALAAFSAAHDLSPREHEVFVLWVTGHGLKHIENTLFISESTVKTHLRSIYRKCDTHNRAEIIALFESESAR